jgi:hypothetical protein
MVRGGEGAFYPANGVVNSGRPSGPVPPPTRTLALPGSPVPNAGRAVAGLPSTFPPPDAMPRVTGRNRRGRPVTAENVGRPLAHVTGNDRDQAGMGREPQGDGGAACKTAGIAENRRVASPGRPRLNICSPLRRPAAARAAGRLHTAAWPKERWMVAPADEPPRVLHYQARPRPRP